MTLRLRRYVGMVTAIGLIYLGTASTATAHPNGWHTWKKYRRAHVNQLLERPELTPTKVLHGSLAAEWERYLKQRRRLERLRERWQAFDAAYWESIEDNDPVIAASVPTTPSAAPASSGSVNWLAIADCESGDSDGQPPYTPNWYIDSTYDGGLQFHPETWWGYGGRDFAEYAFQASPSQQIAVAERVLAGQGIGAWPICGRYA